MNKKYPNLKRAELSIEFLKTNSSNHSFIFGALAEIVDNARDANSSNLYIEHSQYSTKSHYADFMLTFRDDGDGMDPCEAQDVIVLGKSNKRCKNPIGYQGNGLKSGSMRVAKDLMVFTKKDNICTVILLSRSFYEEEEIKEIIVPMPSFYADSMQPWIDYSTSIEDGLEKHNQEMQLIYRYSPFKTFEQINEKFYQLGNNGTLIVLYNLNLSQQTVGFKPELDVTSDPYDVKITGYQNSDSVPERSSFREFLKILYSNPKMKIFIQNAKVDTMSLINCLFLPSEYECEAHRIFNEKLKKEFDDAANDYKAADETLARANETLHTLKNSFNYSLRNVTHEDISKQNKLILKLHSEALNKKQIKDEKERILKQSKKLLLQFGVNLNNKSQDGFYYYNNNRLIKMYQRPLKSYLNDKFNGIVGIIDLSYDVMKPTNNKQDFNASDAEKNKIDRLFVERLEHYIGKFQEEIQRRFNHSDINRFWIDMGYPNLDFKMPIDDDSSARKRLHLIPIYIQCNSCLMWRKLGNDPRLIEDLNKSIWVCNFLRGANGKCGIFDKVDIKRLVYEKPVRLNQNQGQNNQPQNDSQFDSNDEIIRTPSKRYISNSHEETESSNNDPSSDAFRAPLPRQRRRINSETIDPSYKPTSSFTPPQSPRQPMISTHYQIDIEWPDGDDDMRKLLVKMTENFVSLINGISSNFIEEMNLKTKKDLATFDADKFIKSIQEYQKRKYAPLPIKIIKHQ